MRSLTVCACFMLALQLVPRSAAAQELGANRSLSLSLSAPILASSRAPAYDLAAAQPGTGHGMIMAGWIISAWGALNFALLPLCNADFTQPNGQNVCRGLAIGFGVVGLGVGLPLLIFGYHQRAKYEAWRKRHALAALLSRVQIAPLREGAALTYRDRF